MAEPRPIGYFDEAVVESEFAKKFNNCFVQLKSSEFSTRFWQLQSNSDASSVQFYDAGGTLLSVNSGVITSDLQIFVVFPEEGWYYHPGTDRLYLIYRVPTKQWRRAPNSDNMQISCKAKVGLAPVGISQTLLDCTISPVNEKKDHFLIIDRKFLRIRANPEWSILYYMDAEIGFYNHKEDCYFMPHHWYRLPSSIANKVTYCKYFSPRMK
jgi:hypothetical protein